jgi:malate dehydrogenase (quinone)
MLGASPGASTAVWIIIKVVERCFGEQLKNGAWLSKLQEMIPSYGHSLADDPELLGKVRAETAAVLNINNNTKKENIAA